MKPAGRIFNIEWKRKRFLKSMNTIPIIQRILREIISLSCMRPSVIIDNSMYPIHQIIYIKVYQKSNFFSCKFQI